MKTMLTIKNYRCFVSPATVEFARGFTAFVGINNTGKSAFMRFLLEFRPLFQAILTAPSLQNSMQQLQQVQNPIHVLDPQEVFSNLNHEPLEFWLEFISEDGDLRRFGNLKACFTVTRGMQWRSEFYINEVKFTNSPAAGINPNKLLMQNTNPVADLNPVYDAINVFAQALYIGPFRNTINVGTKTDYLDIQIGEAFIKQFHELKTGPSKRSNENVSRLTEEIRNIFKFDSLDIAPSASQDSRGPRKIAVGGNRGPLWGEQHRIETRTKRNHSRVNSGRLTIAGDYSRSPQYI